MASYRLVPLARRDLEDIRRSGTERWGPLQAREYAARLYKAMDLIARFPEIGRLRTEFSQPLRLHPVGAHVVAYTVGAQVTVLRILPMRQNLTALLGTGPTPHSRE